MTNKYRVDPRRIDGRKDIVELVTDISQRLKRNENALRVGHTSVDDGNFTVRNGDIIFSESDTTESMRLFHGTIPELRMLPLGLDSSHHISMFGFDFGNFSTAVQIGVEKIDNSIDGGKILLWPSGAVFSFQPNVGNEVYIWLNIFEDNIAVRGSWINQNDIDSRQALSVGSVDVGAGVSSLSWSYATTMASRMAPVIGLVDTAGLVTSWNLTAMSTSGFTVTWTGTLAKTVNFWVFRVL